MLAGPDMLGWSGGLACKAGGDCVPAGSGTIVVSAGNSGWFLVCPAAGSDVRGEISPPEARGAPVAFGWDGAWSAAMAGGGAVTGMGAKLTGIVESLLRAPA